MPSPIESLSIAKEIFEMRNEQYGAAYQKAGAIMAALFPDGVTLKTESDFARYNHLTQCIGKLNRYSANLTTGGHIDSALDLINYAAMLVEATND